MNKKILGAIAATIGALGSAIIAVPAQAVEQTVNVKVSVDPVIYLRTFKDVNLKVTQGDLGGDSGDQMATPTDGTALIDPTPPASLNAGSQTSLTKPINELFAVWGNTTKTVNVTVTPVAGKEILDGPTSGKKAKISVDSYIGATSGVPDATEPFVGGVNLKIDFVNASGASTTPAAGEYVGTGGELKVEATAAP